MIVFHWLVCGGLSLAGLWWSLIGWSVAGRGERLPSQPMRSSNLPRGMQN